MSHSALLISSTHFLTYEPLISKICLRECPGSNKEWCGAVCSTLHTSSQLSCKAVPIDWFHLRGLKVQWLQCQKIRGGEKKEPALNLYHHPLMPSPPPTPLGLILHLFGKEAWELRKTLLLACLLACWWWSHLAIFSRLMVTMLKTSCVKIFAANVYTRNPLKVLSGWDLEQTRKKRTFFT